MYNAYALHFIKKLCKVEIERYCNVLFIFGVIFGNGVKGQPVSIKNSNLQFWPRGLEYRTRRDMIRSYLTFNPLQILD